ncbi:hypothetical protein COO91_10584 (plasmid) [Nostoc flagelliforme CCNUN1]|uniref:Uncharacterized protein n=1 Tax=Nostoc flagelliforme CCNUN1 TaxID=2038116 RepID=A0A2K8T9N2_9NOSO|nr:hypothetical protein COO91_10584 [Nostoc flagelliforme CCNUN1]
MEISLIGEKAIAQFARLGAVVFLLSRYNLANNLDLVKIKI